MFDVSVDLHENAKFNNYHTFENKILLLILITRNLKTAKNVYMYLQLLTVYLRYSNNIIGITSNNNFNEETSHLILIIV